MKKLLLALCTLFLFSGLSEAQTLCNDVVPGFAVSCPVDGTTGVTAGKYAKWNSAGTALVIGATTDGPGAYIGVAATTQVGGTAIFYTSASISPIFDGPVVANDYLCISTSTAGDFTDCGASGSTRTLGRINQSISSGGTYQPNAWIWGHIPESIPVLISTSGPVADLGGASYYQFNNASGALTFDLPAGSPGMQRCYRNATGKSGVITIAVTTSNAIDYNGANGTTTTGTLVSGGALGDAVCLVSDAANHWYAFTSRGVWTNN